MNAIRLKTEYLKHPIGLDIVKPQLFWNCAEGVRQTAYRIVCRDENENVLWDSGRVESSSMQAVYAGVPLASRTRITEPLLEGCCLRLAVPRHVRHPCGRRESLYHRPVSGRALHPRRSGISEHLWPRCQLPGKDRRWHHLHSQRFCQLHGHPHPAGPLRTGTDSRKFYVLKYVESGELHYEFDAQYCKPFSKAWKTYV